MADSVHKTIDGHEYEIKPFLGMHGWRMQIKLGKMLGPAVKDAIASLPKGKLDQLMKAEIDPAMIGGGVSAFIEAVAENDPDGAFAAKLLSQTQRNGRLLNEGEINKAYAANYSEMFKALIAVVVANNFFGVGSFGLGAIVSETAARNSPESSTKK